MYFLLRVALLVIIPYYNVSLVGRVMSRDSRLEAFFRDSRYNTSGHVSRLETKRFVMTMHDALSHDVLSRSNTSGHVSLLLAHPKTRDENGLSDR